MRHWTGRPGVPEFPPTLPLKVPEELSPKRFPRLVCLGCKEAKLNEIIVDDCMTVSEFPELRILFSWPWVCHVRSGFVMFLEVALLSDWAELCVIQAASCSWFRSCASLVLQLQQVPCDSTRSGSPCSSRCECESFRLFFGVA